MRILVCFSFFAISTLHAKCWLYLRGENIPEPSKIVAPYSTETEDPLIARARDLHVNEDFKTLADLIPNQISESERKVIEAEAELRFPGKENERLRVQHLLDILYTREKPLESADLKQLGPQRKITAKGLRARAFAYTEQMLGKLWKKTPEKSKNSIIPVPHPFLIAGARFMESYYWDSYFGLQGLLATGRRKIAKMQIENFLYLIENYGQIPNGIRNYYLSRSQPPVISSMIVDYMKSLPKITAKDKAWAENALRILEKDYKNFWMKDDGSRLTENGLNRHWDASNEARPERWGEDDETKLAKTYRDVRAEAESGKDFTAAFEGEITKYNSVMLNSLMYKYEKDLAFLHSEFGNSSAAKEYENAAQKRYNTFNEILWDESRGNYFDYNFETGKHSSILTADVYAALWAGLVPKERMQLFTQSAQTLHGKGGVVSSANASGKQWDAPYAWAPHQFFAIQGLMNSGLNAEAKDIATKWTGAVERIFDQTGLMYEKLDGVNGVLPEDKSGKYPNQPGFLWTNSIYVWTLKNVFNENISER